MVFTHKGFDYPDIGKTLLNAGIERVQFFLHDAESRKSSL